jgi:hypothetical protein
MTKRGKRGKSPWAKWNPGAFGKFQDGKSKDTAQPSEVKNASTKRRSND